MADRSASAKATAGQVRLVENRTVQHYRIIERLGEGGMGVVWRAEDLRLRRQVALKVLSKNLVEDATAVERFETEARLASAINHPHLVSVYDIGSIDDGRFIAMELVDGDNLASLVAARRLRVDETVDWALQIADALAAAHRAGIVHRDVKPANIYVSRTGYVKLGDFGIAKLRETIVDPAATLDSGATAGVVLGSPHYFSPEQAQGEPLDARTDAFSFAATLFGMLTGRRAFQGASAAEVIAAVLREDPPRVTTIRPDVPADLEAIVAKGLEKRREYRYQHMEDVVADLKRLKRDLETGRAVVQPTAAAVRAPKRRRAIAAAMIGAAFLIGAATVHFGSRGLDRSVSGSATSPAAYELSRVTSDAGLERHPSWSPDGRSVAYTSDDGDHLGIWIRQVPGERAIRVSMTSGERRTLAAGLGVAYPAVSRDGRRVAFQGWDGRQYRLYQLNAEGGDPQLVSTPPGDPGNPSWSPDGHALYFQLDQFGRRNIWSVDLQTGQSRQLTQGDADDAHPDVSSDGRRLLFLRQHRDLYVMPTDATAPPELLYGFREHNRLVEWPAWGPRDATIVFSVAEMRGDLFLLRPAGAK